MNYSTLKQLYKNSTLLFVFQLFCLIGFSQTEIKGKLINCRNCEVRAITDASRFEPRKQFLPSKPDRFGNFVFELKEQYRPTVVVIEVNSTKIPVYVEPNVQTWITIKKNATGFDYYFERNLVEENKHLKEYFENFGWLSNHEKGSPWFKNNSMSFPGHLYAKYQSKPDSLQVNYLLKLREQMIQFANNSKSLSKNYTQFIRTYANNASAAYVYSLSSQQNQQLDDADKLLINRVLGTNRFEDIDLVNPSLMPYLRSYVNYITTQADQSKDNLNAYFTFIWKHANQIEGNLHDEYLIYLLDKNLHPSNLQSMKPKIHQFILSLSNMDKITEVTNIYESVKRRFDGRNAPDFVLENKNGEAVSLSSFKGQPVFLAFWSSSCRPCIEGMINSKENKQLLKNEKLKFVYISTDLTKSTWLANKYVKNAGENDVHLWIGKSQPQLKEYDAITLPTYYFISPEGKFVLNFPKSWEAEFINFVKSF